MDFLGEHCAPGCFNIQINVATLVSFGIIIMFQMHLCPFFLVILFGAVSYIHVASHLDKSQDTQTRAPWNKSQSLYLFPSGNNSYASRW
jgi:hypothetical protein